MQPKLIGYCKYCHGDVWEVDDINGVRWPDNPECLCEIPTPEELRKQHTDYLLHRLHIVLDRTNTMPLVKD